MSSALLAIVLAVLAVASLAAASCLSVWAPSHAAEAWTAFIGFSSALLALHIPAPSQVVS